MFVRVLRLSIFKIKEIFIYLLIISGKQNIPTPFITENKYLHTATFSENYISDILIIHIKYYFDL